MRSILMASLLVLGLLSTSNAQQLYSIGSNGIIRADVDGSNQKVIYAVSGAELPWSRPLIAVDSEGGWIYWTTAEPTLKRLSLDDSRVEALFDRHVVGFRPPTGLEYDAAARRVLLSFGDETWCCAPDGSRFRKLFSWKDPRHRSEATALVSGMSPGGSEKTSPSKDTMVTAVRKAFGPIGQTLSAIDAEGLVAFVSMPKRWNRAAAPLVRDYLDPNVSAEKWVKESASRIGELRTIAMEMTAVSIAISHEKLRDLFMRISKNYRTKLACLTNMHIAVAQGNVEAETKALAALPLGTEEGLQNAMELMDMVRPYMISPAIIEIARKTGQEVGDLMKPE